MEGEMKVNLTRLLEFIDIECPRGTTGDWQFNVGSQTSEDKAYAFELEEK